MKQGIKTVIIIIIMATCFFAFIIITQYYTSQQEDKDQKVRLASIGNIQFKGKVINSKDYDYGGRTYFMICVKLDYSNTKDFYIYNNLCCLKIKNGIATIAAGEWDSNFGVPNYVEVNINHNNKVIYSYKNGEMHEYILTLDPRGLPVKNMNACN